MGAQLRAVRQRIRGIQSISKITRAQELIAASRIIKAQQRVRESAPYATELEQAVEALVSRTTNVDHPLVNKPGTSERSAILVLTSDRGFCGGYNSNVLRESVRLRTMLEEQGAEVVTYVSGAKGIGWHRFRGREFLRPASEGGLDEIHLVYTEFVSMLSQRPVVHRILPLEIEESEEEAPSGPVPLYDFEPSPQAVLDALLPWYVEQRIYHALLEAAAAEIAARRRAMKSATDNANELLEEFTREANKARQAEITQEISEIVGGANALAESISGSE
jgi:F-type H+-transporting ATPase subunit gamma